MPDSATTTDSNLRRFSVVVAVVAFVMISIGATVTSRDAGLSIPDGVTNHGGLVPVEQLRSGYVADSGRRYSGADVFSEYFHRAVGWTLGTLTIALAILIYRKDRRPALRRLGIAAVALVALQGAVGALGVILKQPTAMVVPHALLAQTFLALLATIVYFTRASDNPLPVEAPAVRKGTGAFIVFAALQVFFGALYRHDNSPAGLVVHIVGALLFAATAAWFSTVVQSSDIRAVQRLSKPSLALGAALMLQIFLGFLAWLFRRPKNGGLERDVASILFPTLHVTLGACITSASVVMWVHGRQIINLAHAPSERASKVETTA
jgi:cytochrome c oxidase assembly protein subunit 15